MKFLASLVLFFSPALLAETASSKLPEVDPISTGYLLKLTLGLGAVILVIFAFAWLMKKLQLTQNTQNGLIRIISAISVGQRDRIALIEVGDEQILVGLSPGNMQKLHTLKKRVQVTQDDSGEAPNFTDKFNQLLKREPKRDR